MLGLRNLEVYNSAFDITEEINKFEIYTGLVDDGEFSFAQFEDSVAEVFGFSDISTGDLQHEVLGPGISKIYRKLAIKKRQTDGYYIFLIGYTHSPFRDLESYIRLLVGLEEEDIQLVSKHYNSYFTKYEISPGNDSIRDISEVLSRGS